VAQDRSAAVAHRCCAAIRPEAERIVTARDLISLSSLGVDIAPRLADAGVAGIAISLWFTQCRAFNRVSVA
jgi:hypothetical protein